MFDMDGVVKVGDRAVTWAVEQVDAVRAAGASIAFVTNNASRSAARVAEQLRTFGIEASPSDVVTSAQAAAGHVRAEHGEGAPVVLLGAEGLHEAAREAGLVVTEDPSRAVALLSGYAPDARWSEIMRAAVLVRAGLPYVASNTDATIPTSFGVAPGHGTLVQLISEFAGVTPWVAGKPSPPLLLETIERTGGTTPLMVGDRLDTDIAGAHAVGCASLLVMTGVTTMQELVAASGALRPTYVAPDLRGLTEAHPVPSTHEAGRQVLNGWTATVRDGELEVSGTGHEADWLRVCAAAAWRWLDETGDAVTLDSFRVPPGFVTRAGR